MAGGQADQTYQAHRRNEGRNGPAPLAHVAQARARDHEAQATDQLGVDFTSHAVPVSRAGASAGSLVRAVDNYALFVKRCRLGAGSH